MSVQPAIWVAATVLRTHVWLAAEEASEESVADAAGSVGAKTANALATAASVGGTLILKAKVGGTTGCPLLLNADGCENSLDRYEEPVPVLGCSGSEALESASPLDAE
ncbi:hypothetical protein ACFU8Q_40495 [Streptomyces sp. NPDC057543]|uniref:hypothetical protein n=1 Tax=Streptomyces sp. NPDC057543 TaxID=3346163 RepID=UPI0036881860